MYDTFAELGLPPNALVVILGCAGSGKSRLTAMFRPSSVLSADQLRETIAGDPGNQEASADAWAVLHHILDARLRRSLPVVVDATNAAARDRAHLIAAARFHQVPAVALRMDTSLTIAQERNARRTGSRRVPADVVAAQHAELAQVTSGQLYREGFDLIVHADSLPVLRVVLTRIMATRPNLTGEAEAVFGADVARLFAWDEPSDDPEFCTATVSAGGQKLRLRYVADGEPFDNRFEAAVPCPDCGEQAWTAVHGLGQLAAAHEGHPQNDITCECC